MRPLTISQITARRRNAQRSSGPKTKIGRRRASLNRRSLKLPGLAVRNLERLQADSRDFQRVWRDVLAIFGFMGPEMESWIGILAWDIWLKRHCARQGRPTEDLEGIDARLEKNLKRTLHVYRMMNRQWKSNLRRELGRFIKGDYRDFRVALEARLGSTRRLGKEGVLHSAVLEDEVFETSGFADGTQGLRW